ncbi:TetR/AcrR family transcriptional regulator [Halobacteria archaeon HArc-gm2]|nr:TetR/AcrR family transcriptional regulator [Halobacteria archaeon HArc-gm2]
MGTTSGTEQRIREAAFRALAKHGYADLSLTDIGEELGQNPSILYHYFDSKDDLLLSMLEDFVDIFIGKRSTESDADPEATLRQTTDQILHPKQMQVEAVMNTPPADIETAMSRVFVELWAHATWDDEFRNETTQVERSLREMIAQTIRTGIDQGDFRQVDAELTADHILFLLMQGVHTRATTNQETSVERVQTIIDSIIVDLRRSNADTS